MTRPLLEDTGFVPEATDLISGAQAARVAATFDVDPDLVLPGGLPVPWHWAFFVPTAPTAFLGEDGHPRRRNEMASFPRRMWVGGHVRSHRTLELDRPAVRTSALATAERKEGSTGTFWLVTVEHSISQDDRVCIEETQDLVFREAPPPSSAIPPLPSERVDPPEAPWVEELSVSSPLVFRYSAITFNSHRIHYDAPYATTVEGYPGVVVQGPLLATLLAHFARNRSGRNLASIIFRLRSPVFLGQPCWLTGSIEGNQAQTQVINQSGAVAASLDAQLV